MEGFSCALPLINLLAGHIRCAIRPVRERGRVRFQALLREVALGANRLLFGDWARFASAGLDQSDHDGIEALGCVRRSHRWTFWAATPLGCW